MASFLTADSFIFSFLIRSWFSQKNLLAGYWHPARYLPIFPAFVILHMTQPDKCMNQEDELYMDPTTP